METRLVLHGVLLALDVTAFRGWGNESVLDHGAGGVCFIRTDRAKDLAPLANIRDCPARVRDLVSFLGEARQLGCNLGRGRVPARRWDEINLRVASMPPVAATVHEAKSRALIYYLNGVTGMPKLNAQSPSER